MKIIFLCHYFPPQDNVGVRRVTFWANYFANAGHEIKIITTKKKDSSRLYEVIDKRIDVYEYNLFSIKKVSKEQVSRLNSESNNLVKKRKLVLKDVFFRGLLKLKRRFVNPLLGQMVDHRLLPVLTLLMLSKLGIIKRQLSFLEGEGKKIIISTVPPWPSHILGIHLSKKYRVSFLADYRDPFSNNHVFSSRLNFIEEKIDSYIGSNAHSLSTVSPTWQEYYSKFNKNVILLRNGFDENLFKMSFDGQRDLGKYLTSQNTIYLSYFGTIENYARMPLSLLRFLESTDKNIKVRFYGSCSLIEEYIETHPLVKDKVEICGKVNYLTAIQEMQKSMINLVAEAEDRDAVSNRGLIPTKVYEYLAAMRPIIAVVNEKSDMVEILIKSGLLIHEISGEIDYESILDRNNLAKLTLKPDRAYITSLSRQKVADEFLNYLEKIH